MSHFEKEDEILLSMHTIFRIRDIKPIDENNRLFQVDLTLTSDNDKDLYVLTDRIREETEGSIGYYRLGLLLLKIGQSEQAQQVYEVMLDQTSDESEKGRIYHQIGWAKQNQGDYKEAIISYEKSLEVYKKTLPLNHSSLASSYNNLGNVYFSMDEYSNALLSHEKAFAIREQSFSPHHPDLSMSYGHIGNVYFNLDKYSEALTFCELAVNSFPSSVVSKEPRFSKNEIIILASICLSFEE